MNNSKLKIGIAGIGMVGSQLMRYFTEVRAFVRGDDLFVYDKNPARGMQDDLERADIVFVCVPTPPSKRNGMCDTSAIDTTVAALQSGKVIVIKSTVPPGTTARLQKKYPQHKFLFNPEFLTESRAWEDMVRPDRQVVGFTTSSDDQAAQVLNLLPRAFFMSPGVLGTYNFVRVNATEAEIGKYAGNIFGALKVSYANILADICQATEHALSNGNHAETVAYRQVRSLLAYDSRIGDAWLNVDHNLYRGFGGACFPKDVCAFRSHVKTLLARLPRNAKERKRFQKAVQFLDALWEYNEALLESQGLTVEDVSVHDKEWIEKKVSARGGSSSGGKNQKAKEI